MIPAISVSPKRAAGAALDHALRRTFVTRDREGHSVFDISQMTALYTSPMIASTWHPRHYGALTQGFRAGNFGVGAQAVGNLFREFGPDLKHLFAQVASPALMHAAANALIIDPSNLGHCIHR